MEDARIKVQIVSADMPQVELDTFDQTYNDGKWHTGTYIISTKNFKKIHELSTNFFLIICSGTKNETESSYIEY